MSVVNTNDSGVGSLRQAILDANSLSNSQPTILFSIPAGPQTINLLSPLPQSTHPIVAQLDVTQNVTIVSPAGSGQDNLSALTKVGSGTLTISGANNPTGNIQVDSGLLRLNAGATTSSNSQPFGPVQGVDGEPLADLWPNGGMVANGNAFARSPLLFTTQAGTVLAMAEYQASSQDNSGNNNIFVRRSTDNGKTFGPASIISPPPLPGDAALLASWGGTSWIVGSPNVVQRQTGIIYMFYTQTRNGGPQAVAQRQYVYRYMTSNDDGRTWSSPTDITPVTSFAGNQNVATITSVSDPTPGVVRIGLTFKTGVGSLPTAHSLLKITGLVNDPMGLNGNTYWISNVVSNTQGMTAVVELAGTPAWSDGTTVGPAAAATPQSVWLGTVAGGEPLLRSGRIVIPLYYRYDTSGSGFEPFVGCIYSDDGATFSRGMLANEAQTALFGGGGVANGTLEPHFTELTTNNHLYISCNTKSGYHGHLTSDDGGQTWTAALDDGTNGSTVLKDASTPAPVVALGGGKFVLVAPDSSTARQRLTAFLSTDECATWSNKIPLYTDIAQYSDLTLAGGNILCAYERGHTDTDVNFQGVFGNLIGQIGLVTFNLAALAAGVTEQVVYNFNELPVGENAWSGAASIVDYGTGDHRATTTGAPVYTSAPAGNGQTALTFHNGDALVLASSFDPTFDPDALATDSGDATFEFDYSIANHGFGALLGGDSRVGAGTKGIVVVVNPNGTVSMTVDDGAHHATITSSTDATNDGAYHRVVCQRDVVGRVLRMWTYRSDGSLTETVTAVADPTTIAAGSLWNGTEPTYLCRYGNTTAGGMTQNVTFDLFRYAKKALPTSQFTAIPSVARAAEQLPLPGAATPDTVASSNLKLWLFDSRGGYSMRTNLGSSPTPANPANGYGADYLLDSSGHGYYTAAGTAALTATMWRGVDPNVGGYWTVPGTLNPKPLDNSTIGQFDYISRFSSAWTIAGMFRFPAATIGTSEVLLTNMDAAPHGFSIGTAYAGTRRISIEVANEKGYFLAEVTVPGGGGFYSADTWYYFALVFNGSGATSGGISTQGLAAYLIPLTGAQLSLADVTSNKSSNLDGGLLTGNTAAATVGSTANLRVAGGANSESQVADLCIWNSALTDANILTLADGRVEKQTATIDGDGTLELAGPDSAMLGGNARANIVNTSSAAAGLLVSSTNELVGGIDGTGNTMLNAGAQLTASHIVQNTLVIGGTATSRATMTLAASDTQGRPSGVATSISDSPADAGSTAAAGNAADSPTAAPSTAAGFVGATSAETGTRSPAIVPDSSSTRSTATEGSVVQSGLATVEISLNRTVDDRTPVGHYSESTDRPEETSNPVSSATQRTLPPAYEPTTFIETADAPRPSSPSLPSALDSVFEDCDSWLAGIDPTLDLLVDAWRRSDIA